MAPTSKFPDTAEVVVLADVKQYCEMLQEMLANPALRDNGDPTLRKWRQDRWRAFVRVHEASLKEKENIPLKRWRDRYLRRFMNKKPDEAKNKRRRASTQRLFKPMMNFPTSRKRTGRDAYRVAMRSEISKEVANQRKDKGLGKQQQVGLFQKALRAWWNGLSDEVREAWNEKAKTEAVEPGIGSVFENQEQAPEMFGDVLRGSIGDGPHKVGDAAYHLLYAFKNQDGGISVGSITAGKNFDSSTIFNPTCQTGFRVSEEWYNWCKEHLQNAQGNESGDSPSTTVVDATSGTAISGALAGSESLDRETEQGADAPSSTTVEATSGIAISSAPAGPGSFDRETEQGADAPSSTTVEATSGTAISGAPAGSKSSDRETEQGADAPSTTIVDVANGTAIGGAPAGSESFDREAEQGTGAPSTTIGDAASGTGISDASTGGATAESEAFACVRTLPTDGQVHDAGTGETGSSTGAAITNVSNVHRYDAQGSVGGDTEGEVQDPLNTGGNRNQGRKRKGTQGADQAAKKTRRSERQSNPAPPSAPATKTHNPDTARPKRVTRPSARALAAAQMK